ncbi:MAG: DUF288 domain-containing protein [Anaerolineae bacterium]|nr:DUF288 domain-containing protein [Anaerolineae bacterium]
MKKFIVITTINSKSAGIERFEQLDDWHIVLVGDRKSPPIESSDRLTFLSVEAQQALGYSIVEVCPYNHYTRKNIGYLYAMQQGADVIYDTDDDNLPYPHWALSPFACNRQLVGQRRYVNIYRHFTDEAIWPRGYPLDEILQPAAYEVVDTDEVEIGAWQGLADDDPDVDAIYRLVVGKAIQFEDRESVFLGQEEYCPFNSQNTFWNKKAFPYLYLPATVSFRYTDILRGYLAQYLMWQQGLHLGFTKATVYQERNEHNLIKDFESEVEVYLHTKPIVDLLARSKDLGDPLAALRTVYETLVGQRFVQPEELAICKAWVNDCQTLL